MMIYDRHQYPMSINKDHLVGQLTITMIDQKDITWSIIFMLCLERENLYDLTPRIIQRFVYSSPVLKLFSLASVAMGDRFWLFIQTLNIDQKPFNSIFNSKTKSNYSFKEFIHSKTESNYSFKELFIQIGKKQPSLRKQAKGALCDLKRRILFMFLMNNALFYSFNNSFKCTAKILIQRIYSLKKNPKLFIQRIH